MKTFRTKSVPHRLARQARTDRLCAAEGDFLGHPRGLTIAAPSETSRRGDFFVNNHRLAKAAASLESFACLFHSHSLPYAWAE
jgi:hypothetical protein